MTIRTQIKNRFMFYNLDESGFENNPFDHSTQKVKHQTADHNIASLITKYLLAPY